MWQTRWIGLVVAWLALWPGLGWGQTSTSFTFHAGATSVTNGAVMSAANFSTIIVQIEGTFVGTVQFEKKTKGATSYVAVQCTNAADRTLVESSTDGPGYWECPGGAYSFRVPVTARTSGTIIVTGMGTTAVASKSGGGSVAGVTLGQAATNGRMITNATTATPVEIGNGVQAVEVGGDATLGGFIRPKPLGDTKWDIFATFKGCIRDNNALANMFCYTPGAASPLLMYQYQENYRPLKSVFLSAWSLHGDGTNCPARPTVVTISNMLYPTFICTENNSSRLKFAIPMRPNWDGGVIYIKPYYAQTAADTGSVALEVAAACRAFGTAFNGAYGTEVDVDDAALAGSGAIESTMSAAITPNGTCAAGHMLFGYIDVDATDNPTTAAATLHFIGADIFWSETSPSH